MMPPYTKAQDIGDTQMAEAKIPALVLKEAQQRGETTAAVEVYLIEDILEVTVYATMYAARPQIYNVTLVGPGLGRLAPLERQSLRATAKDKQLIFETKDREGGFIRFTKRTKKKKMQGAITKELIKFKIPTKRVIPKKRYELRIKLESGQIPGKYYNFKFRIEDLAGLLTQSSFE
jgi:hypothetical protein